MKGKWKALSCLAAGHFRVLKPRPRGMESQKETQGSEPEISEWARVFKLRVQDNQNWAQSLWNLIQSPRDVLRRVSPQGCNFLEF